MQLSPRHDSVPVVVDLAPPDELVTLVGGQRRRLAQLLTELAPHAWGAPSRCAGWTVRDVAAHLVTVNGYWAASVRAAVAGDPLRILRAFDPVATPAALVHTLDGVEPADLLARLVASHGALDTALGAVAAAQWSLPAETPLGHVALAELAAHALWDAWVHERDITVPLGIAAAPEVREVARGLRYVSGLTASLALLHDLGPLEPLAVAADDDRDAFVIDLQQVDGIAQVVVRDGEAGGRPCLRGRALDLLEALSLRAPMPEDAPAAWTVRVRALAAAFDLA